MRGCVTWIQCPVDKGEGEGVKISSLSFFPDKRAEPYADVRRSSAAAQLAGKPLAWRAPRPGRRTSPTLRRLTAVQEKRNRHTSAVRLWAPRAQPIEWLLESCVAVICVRRRYRG